MRTAILTMLAVLGGCGVYHGPPRPVGGGTLPGNQPDPAPGLVDVFPIDAGAGIDLPNTAYAITTNGVDWTIAWLGGARSNNFHGEIYTDAGQLSGVQFDGAYAGDRASQPAANHVVFDAVTDGSNVQSLTFTSNVVPVRFNLGIDGTSAVGDVVFSSGGIASTTDVMPFGLTVLQGAKADTRTPPAAKASDGTTSARKSPYYISAPTPRSDTTR